MTYKINDPKNIQNEISRIATEQLNRAVYELTDDDIDRDEGVHQARKCFKKIRALLRLIKEELGDNYKIENNFYRDLGRDLSDVRDAQAAVETFERIREIYPEEIDNNRYIKLYNRLLSRRENIAQNQLDLECTISEVVDSLIDGRNRINEWKLSSENFSNVKLGADRSYKRGRKQFKKSWEDRSEERFHEWRKRIKDLWYHCRLLHDIWPDLMNVYIENAKRTSDLLGDDHDLSLFRNLLEKEDDLLNNDNSNLMIKIIDSQQSRLRGQATTLGCFIYVEKPRQYTNRLQKYWEIWSNRSNNVVDSKYNL